MIVIPICKLSILRNIVMKVSEIVPKAIAVLASGINANRYQKSGRLCRKISQAVSRMLIFLESSPTLIFGGRDLSPL